MTSPSSSVQEARKALGQRLAEIRKAAGLTKRALAQSKRWAATPAAVCPAYRRRRGRPRHQQTGQPQPCRPRRHLLQLGRLDRHHVRQCSAVLRLGRPPRSRLPADESPHGRRGARVGRIRRLRVGDGRERRGPPPALTGRHQRQTDLVPRSWHGSVRARKANGPPKMRRGGGVRLQRLSRRGPGSGSAACAGLFFSLQFHRALCGPGVKMQSGPLSFPPASPDWDCLTPWVTRRV